MTECFGNSVAEFRAVLHRPQSQQRPDRSRNPHIRTSYDSGPGSIVRNKRHGAYAQMLPESLIVSEQLRRKS